MKRHIVTNSPWSWPWPSFVTFCGSPPDDCPTAGCLFTLIGNLAPRVFCRPPLRGLVARLRFVRHTKWRCPPSGSSPPSDSGRSWRAYGRTDPQSRALSECQFWPLFSKWSPFFYIPHHPRTPIQTFPKCCMPGLIFCCPHYFKWAVVWILDLPQLQTRVFLQIHAVPA